MNIFKLSSAKYDCCIDQKTVDLHRLNGHLHAIIKVSINNDII